MTLQDALAEAICNAFWRLAEEPRTYAGSPPMQRQVWQDCAAAAIERARQFKAAKATQNEAA